MLHSNVIKIIEDNSFYKLKSLQVIYSTIAMRETLYLINTNCFHCEKKWNVKKIKGNFPENKDYAVIYLLSCG